MLSPATIPGLGARASKFKHRALERFAAAAIDNRSFSRAPLLSCRSTWQGSLDTHLHGDAGSGESASDKIWGEPRTDQSATLTESGYRELWSVMLKGSAQVRLDVRDPIHIQRFGDQRGVYRTSSA